MFFLGTNGVVLRRKQNTHSQSRARLTVSKDHRGPIHLRLQDHVPDLQILSNAESRSVDACEWLRELMRHRQHEKQTP